MKRLLHPGWLACHVAMVVLVVTFLALGRWQIGRAAHGNALSFGYSLEWPFFALFVIYVWLREVRGVLRAQRPAGTESAPAREPAAPAGTTRFDLDAALAARAERDRALHTGAAPEHHPLRGDVDA